MALIRASRNRGGKNENDYANENDYRAMNCGAKLHDLICGVAQAI